MFDFEANKFLKTPDYELFMEPADTTKQRNTNERNTDQENRTNIFYGEFLTRNDGNGPELQEQTSRIH